MFRKLTYLLVVVLLYICSFSLATLAPVCTPRAVVETPQVSSMNVTLPQSVGGWTLSGPAKRVEPSRSSITWTAPENSIWDIDSSFSRSTSTRTPARAIFSSNSTGWILPTMPTVCSPATGAATPWISLPRLRHATPSIVRALYGAGLLRIWSSNLYARVMTYQESDASKQAVLAMGKAIVAGRPEAMAPRLIQALPQAVGSQFALRADRTVYLRSHLVLNSVYFLSSENILDLGLDCEMAAAVYRRNSGADSSKQVHVLLVRYPAEGCGA